jgi:PAS domain S-box-containing protein
MLAVVADGDAGRADLLRAELERHGHRVVLAADAREVLQAAVEPDTLAVLGSHLPGADDAVALCRSLHAGGGAHEPVVVVVGGRDEVDTEAALAAGAADVWTIEPGGATGALDVRLELARHYARLQTENLRVGGEFALMRKALDLSGTGFVLTDPRLDDDPIVYVNHAFLEMTGYDEREVIGRNCRFLQGPSTDPADVGRIRAALREGRPFQIEVVNHRRDGTPFFNELHVAPMRDDQGRVVRHVGVQLDVTAYRVTDSLLAAEQQARAAAEAAERRSSFLAAASPTLGSHLDLAATLESLARLAVPFLADVCLVETFGGGEMRRVAASASRPGLERELLALPPTSPLDPDGPLPLARVLRTGRAEIVDARDGPIGDPAVHELLAAAGADGPPPRWMLVPLRARGRAIGVVALAGLAPERAFGVEELALARDVASRAALALDNARLYEQQLEIAGVLQASFLPAVLPEIAGLELAARYRPADGPADIGGDFYDLLELGEGTVALTVGDVTGKGAAAAALTGLCRHTVRTAWGYERRAAEVLRTLNHALVTQQPGHSRYATVLAATLTPGPGGVAVEVVCAGHPAARVLRADGRVEVLGERGTILGWQERLDLRPAQGLLAPGEALVVFTDGVSSGDAGGPLTTDALEQELTTSAGRDAEALADRLEAAALQAQEGHPVDDVVIVVARAAA